MISEKIIMVVVQRMTWNGKRLEQRYKLELVYDELQESQNQSIKYTQL